jgi:hypothetical protein
MRAGWSMRLACVLAGFAVGVLTGFAGRAVTRLEAPADIASASRVDDNAALERAVQGQRQILEALGALREPLAGLAAPQGAVDARSPAQPDADDLEASVRSLSEHLIALLGDLERIQAPLPVRAIASRPPGLERVSLTSLRALSKDELTASMQWRTYSDVLQSLGRPTTVNDADGYIVWIYDPKADWVRLRFVDGYVIEAFSKFAFDTEGK